jgi:hypothetical protein
VAGLGSSTRDGLADRAVTFHFLNMLCCDMDSVRLRIIHLMDASNVFSVSGSGVVDGQRIAFAKAACAKYVLTNS